MGRAFLQHSLERLHVSVDDGQLALFKAELLGRKHRERDLAVVFDGMCMIAIPKAHQRAAQGCPLALYLLLSKSSANYAKTHAGRRLA
jgi:hypothetical protein